MSLSKEILFCSIVQEVALSKSTLLIGTGGSSVNRKSNFSALIKVFPTQCEGGGTVNIKSTLITIDTGGGTGKKVCSALIVQEAALSKESLFCSIVQEMALSTESLLC